MIKNPLVWRMCVGQICNLLPHVVVPAVMTAHLIPQWGLTNSAAGLLAAAYACGYMIAVPVLTSLTDRYDARLILLLGSAASALATMAFGVFAEGFLSGLVIWFIAGASFAGAYMPGLRALTDRLDATDSSRSVTLYTSSFSLGVGLSFLVSQICADLLGWRWAFLITGACPLVMVAVAAALKPISPPASQSALLDFRPVLRNRPAMGYILGYGAHCFELYGMRTWIVAFWTFVALRHPGDALLSPMAVSVIVTLLAMPASILGNELSIRIGRHRAIKGIQLCSALVAILIAASAAAPPWLLLALVLAYAVTVPADSGSLTSGMSAAAFPQARGVTLAMHSAVGFALSALAGWLVGVALDAAGGITEPNAWSAAFGVLVAGILMGPMALMWSARARTSS